MSFKVEKKDDLTGPTPAPGTKVKVHYTGKLTNGQVFDSSVSRGEPLEFIVGVGQVIKGWDEGIVQLRKGEKAVLTCPPAYAYGPNGYPPVIPPNATLKFKIELLEIN